MADRDDLPYIVIERRSFGLGSFIYGALLGAGIALLYAPRSGRETREEIRTGMLRVRDKAEDAVRHAQQTVTGTLDDVREEVNDRLDAARDAFEAGREAARETRADLERRVRETKAGMRAGAHAARGGNSTVSPESPPSAPADADETGLGV
jgi:gas vesicle protein